MRRQSLGRKTGADFQTRARFLFNPDYALRSFARESSPIGANGNPVQSAPKDARFLKLGHPTGQSREKGVCPRGFGQNFIRAD
jgi:hypothetical protein